MIPEGWTFGRFGGQGTETVSDVPVFDAHGDYLLSREYTDTSDPNLSITTASAYLLAHWKAIRMRPRYTGYCGHLKLASPVDGIVYVANGTGSRRRDGNDWFRIEVVSDVVSVRMAVSGSEVVRSFSGVDTSELDVRWRVADTSLLIVNGQEISAGSVVHGLGLWYSYLLGATVRHIYLIDSPVPDEIVRGWQ